MNVRIFTLLLVGWGGGVALFPGLSFAASPDTAADNTLQADNTTTNQIFFKKRKLRNYSGRAELVKPDEAVVASPEDPAGAQPGKDDYSPMDITNVGSSDGGASRGAAAAYWNSIQAQDAARAAQEKQKAANELWIAPKSPLSRWSALSGNAQKSDGRSVGSQWGWLASDVNAMNARVGTDMEGSARPSDTEELNRIIMDSLFSDPNAKLDDGSDAAKKEAAGLSTVWRSDKDPENGTNGEDPRFQPTGFRQYSDAESATNKAARIARENDPYGEEAGEDSRQKPSVVQNMGSNIVTRTALAFSLDQSGYNALGAATTTVSAALSDVGSPSYSAGRTLSSTAQKEVSPKTQSPLDNWGNTSWGTKTTNASFSPTWGNTAGPNVSPSIPPSGAVNSMWGQSRTAGSAYSGTGNLPAISSGASSPIRDSAASIFTRPPANYPSTPTTAPTIKPDRAPNYLDRTGGLPPSK